MVVEKGMKKTYSNVMSLVSEAVANVNDMLSEHIDPRNLKDADSLVTVALYLGIEQLVAEKMDKVSLDIVFPVRDASDLARQVWFSLPRKVILVDLDDTLWDGILVEDGVVSLNLPLQKWLLEQKKKGVLLGIISKNDKGLIERQFDELNMPLRLEDFITYRINMIDKARNVLSIADELNIGLQSIVFIDDSAYERDRVSGLEEVLVISPDEYESLRCFSYEVTDEDLKRHGMYKAEKQRQELMAFDDWLSQLGITVTFHHLVPGSKDVDRVVQLINKVSQMNMATRRMSKNEFLDWVSQAGYECWYVSVSDKFGDYGIVGVMTWRPAQEGWVELVDFVMSCRAMGRNIEYAMLAFVREYVAKDDCLVCLVATPSTKNAPFMNFLRNYQSTLSEPGEYPEYVKVILP